MSAKQHSGELVCVPVRENVYSVEEIPQSRFKVCCGGVTLI